MKSKFNILFEQVMNDIEFLDKISEIKATGQGEISPEMLEKFAESKNIRVRYEVAKNPSTPIKVLRKLADDKIWNVRYEVAKNPSTPIEVLRKLADDDRWEVRKGVTYNPSTPVEILMKLAEDKDGSVKRNAKRQIRHLKQ